MTRELRRPDDCTCVWTPGMYRYVQKRALYVCRTCGKTAKAYRQLSEELGLL